MNRNSLCSLAVGVMVLCAGAPARAAGTLSATATPAPEIKKPWSAGLSFDHYLSHRNDVNAYTLASAFFLYDLSARHSVKFALSATKFYSVDLGQSEFPMDDPAVSHSFQILKDFYGFGLRTKEVLTLPLSKASRDAGVVTRAKTGLLISRAFLNEKLTVRYKPYFQYNFANYTTSIDGLPLAQWSWGNPISFEVAASSKVGLNLDLGWSYSFNYKSPYAAERPPANGRYFWDLYGSYEISKTVSPRIGATQGDSLVQNGRIQVNAYDPINTRYYLAVDFSI